jgi:hypothetical protein
MLGHVAASTTIFPFRFATEQLRSSTARTNEHTKVLTHLVVVLSVPRHVGLFEPPPRQRGELLVRGAPTDGGRVHVVAERVAHHRDEAAEQEEEEEGERVDDGVPGEQADAERVQPRRALGRAEPRVEHPHVAHHEPHREEQLQERPRLVHQIRAVPAHHPFIISYINFHQNGEG